MGLFDYCMQVEFKGKLDI